MKILDNYFDINKIPDYCSKDKLEKFYGYYLHNLKAGPYVTRWITLDEIAQFELKSWRCIGDKYLEESENDRNKLMMDIYESGTYFPMFVGKQRNEPYRLRDGAHRLYVMRKLIEMRLWNIERKILVATDEIIEGRKEDEEILYYLPMVVREEFKDNYTFIYRELDEKAPLQYPDTEHELAVYNTKRGGYLAAACISLLLRNAFFEYRQKNGIPIKPSPVINDYAEWEKWRGF